MARKFLLSILNIVLFALILTALNPAEAAYRSSKKKGANSSNTPLVEVAQTPAFVETNIETPAFTEIAATAEEAVVESTSKKTNPKKRSHSRIIHRHSR